jgi:uncharacterized NAD(P)/FAD-binding protein YdhS
MKKATVAIIGGGFCGTLAAIRLLTPQGNGTRSLPFGSRIVLIEPGRAGEGLAYRSGPDAWRLNVPAQRMSAFDERPLDFLEWARGRDPLVKPDDCLPRSWYGDYLSGRLELARQASPRWLHFERMRARVTGVDVFEDAARITLSDGAVLEAERVLLALGNGPASAPLSGVAAGEAISDPWNLDWLERLPTYVPRILLVGTGLTMIDQALAIAEQRPDARLLAISRHGLLPRPQGGAMSENRPGRFDARRRLARGALADRLRQFRDAVDAGRGDWRLAVQQVRESMPDLWRGATPRQRRQFLRHLRAFWDVHRHRAPQDAAERIDALRRRKRLEIAAGRLVGTRRIDGGIVATWLPRGGAKPREDLVDAVVNVTGPDADPRRSDCPLVQSLLAQGQCRPDELGLGWLADRDGRLLRADGTASDVLFYAGPWLRATHWEATAVPELRAHVDRAVRSIASGLATRSGSLLRALARPAFRRAPALSFGLAPSDFR